MTVERMTEIMEGTAENLYHLIERVSRGNRTLEGGAEFHALPAIVEALQMHMCWVRCDDNGVSEYNRYRILRDKPYNQDPL